MPHDTDVPTIPDDYAELIKGTATLTTISPTGYPQTSAIWGVLDDDGRYRTSLHASRQKFKNLKRHPKASLFWIDPADPQRTLEVRGDVTLEEDTDLTFMRKLLDGFGISLETFPAPKDNRYVVTLTPTRVRTTPDE